MLLLKNVNSVAHQHIQLFLNKLRYVKSAPTGNDLQKMGVESFVSLQHFLGRLAAHAGTRSENNRLKYPSPYSTRLNLLRGVPQMGHFSGASPATVLPQTGQTK